MTAAPAPRQTIPTISQKPDPVMKLPLITPAPWPVQTAPIEAPLDIRVVLTINGALVLLLGLLPGSLMALCARAVSRMMAA